MVLEKMEKTKHQYLRKYMLWKQQGRIFKITIANKLILENHIKSCVKNPSKVKNSLKNINVPEQ